MQTIKIYSLLSISHQKSNEENTSDDEIIYRYIIDVFIYELNSIQFFSTNGKSYMTNW